MSSIAVAPSGSVGRYVVVFPVGTQELARLLRRLAGVSDVLRSADVSSSGAEDLAGAGAVVFDHLGIAVVQADPDQAASLRGASTDVVSVEPELVHHPLGIGSPDYLAGYRDGVTDLTGRLGAAAPTPGDTRAEARFGDTDAFTWGLQAVGADATTATGQGIKVAVLDTGFTLDHPDFAGREVTAQSFVDGEDARDVHGHGTHCVGTACGPQAPAGSRRYGVAFEAQIFVGKVLGNNGSGTDTNILAGIDWALGAGCEVISMSLGADVQQVSAAYERAGAAALAAGTLIVAAAGNNAKRPDDGGFVGVPANSPSIMAVAALDPALAVAPFSATSNPVPGGQVDIAAPGVDIYSSWLLPQRYNTISGTSMATPHVAGLAALHAQATGQRGRDLWTRLTQSAQRIDAPSVDVGSGLAHAPS